MRRFSIILLILCSIICLPFYSSAKAKKAYKNIRKPAKKDVSESDTRVRGDAIKAENRAEESSADDELTSGGGADTIEGEDSDDIVFRTYYDPERYKRKVDRNVDAIEKKVQSLADKYRSGSIWDAPVKTIPPNESGGHRLLRYTLSVPTYIIRGVTWPVALLGDFLIRKGVVKTLVNLASNDARTFWVYPKLELGFGSGFGGGVGIRHLDLFHRNYKLSASYQIHVNLNHEANVSLKDPDAFYYKGKPFSYKVAVNFIRHNENAFFGPGINSSTNNDSKYGIDQVRVGGWCMYEFMHNLMLRWRTYFIYDSSRHGKGGRSVETFFPMSELVSFNEELYYADVGISLIHDSRNSDVFPENGGVRRFRFHRFQGLKTSRYDYNEYVVDISQYIRALMPRHVLAMRFEWSYQQQTGDGGIPFYRMSKLDVNAPMRGFDFGRFTDRGVAVINLEYRFPVWDYIDGQLFFDTGRVFHEPTDFSFKRFKYDGGAGIRVRTKDYFLMRIQVAYGGEGVKFLLKTHQAF